LNLRPLTSGGGTMAMSLCMHCVRRPLGPRLGDPGAVGYDRPWFTSLGPPRGGPGLVCLGSLVIACLVACVSASRLCAPGLVCSLCWFVLVLPWVAPSLAPWSSLSCSCRARALPPGRVARVPLTCFALAALQVDLRGRGCEASLAKDLPRGNYFTTRRARTLDPVRGPGCSGLRPSGCTSFGPLLGDPGWCT